VVYGAGAVGLAAVAVAAAEGVESIVVVDPLASRRAVAERFGATTVDPGAVESVVDRVKELTGGGAAYGIDTTAIPEVVKQAQQSLAVRGTLVALGLGAPEYVVDAIDLLQAGKTVTSSIEGDSDPQEMVPRLLEMRAAGTFPMDDLVTTYPAEEIGQAVADVTSGAVVKPVLVW
jgi:aryl-alcohol dehydrogenase